MHVLTAQTEVMWGSEQQAGDRLGVLRSEAAEFWGTEDVVCGDCWFWFGVLGGGSGCGSGYTGIGRPSAN